MRYPRRVPRPPSRPPRPESRGGITFLVAGVSKDERAALEARVRQALGSHAGAGAWSVSLVRLGGKWSVTLDGPGERSKSRSFIADDARLQDAIRDAVAGSSEGQVRQGGSASSSAPGPKPALAGRAGEVRDQHVCPQCQKAVVVIYETRPGEPRVSARVACPHCWHVSQVEVGAWAAEGGDYRAEKA
jgi:hypothetical protein